MLHHNEGGGGKYLYVKSASAGQHCSWFGGGKLYDSILCYIWSVLCCVDWDCSSILRMPASAARLNGSWACGDMVYLMCLLLPRSWLLLRHPVPAWWTKGRQLVVGTSTPSNKEWRPLHSGKVSRSGTASIHGTVANTGAEEISSSIWHLQLDLLTYSPSATKATHYHSLVPNTPPPTHLETDQGAEKTST